MKVECPDEFITMLYSFNKRVKPWRVVSLIKWASREPEEAKKICEFYEKVGKLGKSYLERLLLVQHLDPGLLLKIAVEGYERKRKERALLRRLISKAKRGGFHFNLPNGVRCTVTKEGANYRFRFTLSCGAEITALYRSKDLLYTLMALMDGMLGLGSIVELEYKGKKWSPQSRAAPLLLKAIERDRAPEDVIGLFPLTE